MFIIRVSFEKLKCDYNQSLVKHAIGVPSYVKEVKGNVARSRVMWRQLENVIFDVILENLPHVAQGNFAKFKQLILQSLCFFFILDSNY